MSKENYNAKLHVGPSTEGVLAAKEAILAIMNVGAKPTEQDTVRLGLKTLKRICHVSNVTVANCVFEGDKK